MAPEELTFDIWGKKITARLWSRHCGGTPLLALHGWLDNAASFDFLAPLLERPVLAVDFAGNGLSDHRAPEAAYNIWQDVGDMVAVTDQLGWRRFGLVGHSRGAAVAAMVAAGFPERVDRLVLIDGFMPDPVVPEDAPRQLRRAVEDRVRLMQRPRRRYPSLEDAFEPRTRGRHALSREAARAIALRGVDRDAGGFFWRYDQRLRGASEFKLTAEHNEAFIRSLCCPVMLILAADPSPAYRRCLDMNDRIEVLTAPGGHHLHMESPQSLAAEINHFLDGGEQ